MPLIWRHFDSMYILVHAIPFKNLLSLGYERLSLKYFVTADENIVLYLLNSLFTHTSF